MANAEYISPFEEPVIPRPRLGTWGLVFMLALALYGTIMAALLAGGFSTSDGARMASLIGAAGSEASLSMCDLFLIYPAIPFLLGFGLSHLSVVGEAAPYFVDCAAAALLLGLGYRRLLLAHVGFVLSSAMIFALAVNPLFVFVATSGSGVAVALVFTYIFASGAMSLAKAEGLRGLILIAVAYTGMLLTTPLGFYFLLASAPFLVFYASREGGTPLSFLLVVVAVPVIVLGGLFLANWYLLGDASGFLTSLSGGVSGPRAEMSLEPWPYIMGDNPLRVIIVMAAGFFLAFPVLVLALTVVFAGMNMMRATIAMAGITMITGAVTTYLGVLSHPVYLWVFAVPVALLALGELKSGYMGKSLAMAALAAGIFGGWWLLGLHPTLYLTVWRAEMRGGILDVAFQRNDQISEALTEPGEGRNADQMAQAIDLTDAYGVRLACGARVRGGVDVAHGRCANRGDLHLLRGN